MAEKIVYINYVDGIDSKRVKNIMAIISNIVAQENPDTIYFLIASQGGEVDAGIALYNFLKALPVKIVMHNIGSIDSIANVVFIAGQDRFAAPHATFLFHGVQQPILNPTVLSLPQLNEIIDRMHKNHSTIAGIICSNSKMEEDEIKKLFSEGKTVDTEFAIEKGIINKVKPAQIPKNALFVSINIDG